MACSLSDKGVTCGVCWSGSPGVKLALSLHGVRITAIYLVGAVVAASILAWLLDGVIPFSYEKVLSRGVLLFCALGLVPLWRYAGLSSTDVGLKPVVARDLLPSFILGVLLLLPPMLFYLVVGYRVADDRVTALSIEFLLRVLAILGAAALVGLFEEALFRGLLFSALRRRSSVAIASVWVGIAYAAVHFLGAGSSLPEVHDVQWYTGIMVVGAALGGLADPLGYWDSFIALALLGGLLCVVRDRLGLWWCIGLHWAFVFGIRTYKELTVRDVVSPYAVTAGSYDNFVGMAVTVWLLFIVVCALLVRAHRQA